MDATGLCFPAEDIDYIPTLRAISFPAVIGNIRLVCYVTDRVLHECFDLTGAPVPSKDEVMRLFHENIDCVHRIARRMITDDHVSSVSGHPDTADVFITLADCRRYDCGN